MQLDLIFFMTDPIRQKLLVNSQDHAAQLNDEMPLTDHFYDDYFVTTTVAVTGTHKSKNIWVCIPKSASIGAFQILCILTSDCYFWISEFNILWAMNTSQVKITTTITFEAILCLYLAISAFRDLFSIYKLINLFLPL